MTQERFNEIGALLGQALSLDVSHLSGMDKVEASINPDFPTPHLNAAKKSIGKEYDVYAALVEDSERRTDGDSTKPILEAIEIAAATQRICSRNGYGHQVVVWPRSLSESRKFIWDEAPDGNSLTALLLHSGGRILPVVRFKTPCTLREVLEAL